MFGTTNPRYYQTPNGKVPSVTTVLSLLDKPFLKRWAANKAVEYIIKGALVTSKVIKQGDADGIGKETEYTIHDWDINKARTAYKQLSTEAADYGTYIHTLCECYFKGQEIESPHEPTQKLTKSFYTWCKKHNVKPIETETVVYGDGYAGRVDLICEIDCFWYKSKDKKDQKAGRRRRVVALIDFKTGKGTYYPEWGLQTAGYRIAYNQSQTTKFLGDELGVDLSGRLSSDFCAQHHGVLKFNKDTNRVNYKDMTPTFDRDLKAFLLLKDFWWLTNEGEK